MDVTKFSETVILRDDFYSYPSNSVLFHLVLTEKALYVETTDSGKSESEKVNLSDVIGCHVYKSKNVKDSFVYFCIYSYPLKTSSGILGRSVRRERRILSFQTDKFDSADDNFVQVKKWQITICSILRGRLCALNGDVSIPEKIPNAKKFLVLVNPKSGVGKAYQIFKERVVPMFVESDIQYELLITDRPNCARDYMIRMDLSQWNGLVVISGDGLLFEIFNGLMSRPDWKEAVKIPIGVIPGGSGNGLAKSINHAAGEPYDVVTATGSILNVIRGRVAPMDLVRVQTLKGNLFSFLSITWGLMADIDIESERLRVLGELRFRVWAIWRTLALRRYKGKLSYLPVTGYQSSNLRNATLESKPTRSKTMDCNMAWSHDSALSHKLNNEPRDIFRSKSFGNHDPNISNQDVRLLKVHPGIDEADESRERMFSHSQCAKVANSHSEESLDCSEDFEECSEDFEECSEDVPQLPKSYSDDSANCSDEEQRGKFLDSLLPPLDKPVPDDWVVMEDEFALLFVAHQTHMGTDLLMAPDAKLDDGIMWLILIKSGVSRIQVFYFLLGLETGDHINYPFVEMIPIKAFRLEPASSNGFLVVDGEVIPCTPIQAEVLPSFARIMSR